jgi:hypothetical protein
MTQPTAVDFETPRFRPGVMAPPPVCMSTYHPQDGLRLWSSAPGPDNLWAGLDRVLDGRTPVLGHGFAYDSCVILEWAPEELRRRLWAEYEADRVWDSIPTERIIEITTGVRGKLALDELARRYGVTVTKSEVRTDFGRYLGRPLSEYTAEHKRYAGGDAAELWTMFQRQMSRGIAAIRDIADLTRGDLWLRLCSNYGVRTDPARVEDLEVTTQAEVEELTELAQAWGAMATRLTPKQQRDGKWYSRKQSVIKQRVIEAYGWENAPRTDSWDAGLDRNGKQTDPRGTPGHADFDPEWGISISKTVLDESGDPKLEAIAHLGELLAVRNKDVKMLKAGVHEAIHTRFGYAATTRTTSSAPNLQNFRRKKGIRECIMPRAGCVFVGSDYPGLESFTLAQVCKWKLGRTEMLSDLNAGRDLHAKVGAGIVGCSYAELQARRKAGDKLAKTARDCGKYGNFGLCGYMTDPDTFCFYVNMGSRTDDNPKGLQWTVEKAAEVMKQWYANAHDQVAFLKYVDTLRNRLGLYDVEIPGTTIVRRGCTRTAAANTHFQGCGAKVARVAGWKLAKAQYIDRTHPGRTVLFVHDEFVTEVPAGAVEEAARVQERCMQDAVREVCPDVQLHSEANEGSREDWLMLDSAAMRHYSKSAKHERKEGKLVICDV